MIELLDGFPDDVLAVAGNGEITAEDYRTVLMPAALEKMKRHKHLRILCHLGVDFKTFAAGAMWEDTKLLFGHWGEWGRVAVVTDKAWIAEAMHMFAPFFHHPIRVFSNEDIGKARSWIVEPETMAA